MYESPIEKFFKQVKIESENQVCRAVQEVGISVDKEELIKALQYDRGQYEKGYADGIKEFAERLKEIKLNKEILRMPFLQMDIDNLVKEMESK